MKRLVIVNRNAGRLRDEGPLLDALRRRRADMVVCETASVAELGAAVTGFHELGQPEVVGLAGGDGSVTAGLSALERERELRGLPSLPAIAVLPGGTVSTVARATGFDGGGLFGDTRRVAYVDALLDALACGGARERSTPTLRVRWSDRDGRKQERVAFIFGAGLVSRFFDVYYEAPTPSGTRRAAGIVAKVFAGAPFGAPTARRVLAPVPCRVEVDGRDAGLRRVSLVVASVIDDLGLGMRVTYRGRERPDAFHVVASELGPRALAPQLPLVLLGRRLLGDGVDALARSLRLSFEGDEPGSWVLDGEVLTSRSVEVTLGPTIRVVVPSRDL